MKPGIKRTMRVATTFTGAAACAVAFNPAAMAGTARPVQPGHQQDLRRVAIPDNRRLSGSIRSGACAAEWLHIGVNGTGPVCIGYKGLLDMSPYPNMHSFCGGTNSGYIWGNGTLGWSYYHFEPGTYFWHLPKSIPWFYVSEVGIAGWRGSDKCP